MTLFDKWTAARVYTRFHAVVGLHVSVYRRAAAQLVVTAAMNVDHATAVAMGGAAAALNAATDPALWLGFGRPAGAALATTFGHTMATHDRAYTAAVGGAPSGYAWTNERATTLLWHRMCGLRVGTLLQPALRQGVGRAGGGERDRGRGAHAVEGAGMA